MDSGITLWQFLLELLLSDHYQHLICWTSCDGEFKLLDSEAVAKLWGLRKSKTNNMNYDKNIIKKVLGQKFVYRFVSFPENARLQNRLQNKLPMKRKLMSRTLRSSCVEESSPMITKGNKRLLKDEESKGVEEQVKRSRSLYHPPLPHPPPQSIEFNQDFKTVVGRGESSSSKDNNVESQQLQPWFLSSSTPSPLTPNLFYAYNGGGGGGGDGNILSQEHYLNHLWLALTSGFPLTSSEFAGLVSSRKSQQHYFLTSLLIPGSISSLYHHQPFNHFNLFNGIDLMKHSTLNSCLN